MKEEETYNLIEKENKSVKDSYQYNIITAIINTLMFITAMAFLIYSFGFKSPTQYIHADENGKIMKDVPLSEFNESPEETGQWIADALKRSFSYNFTNLETHPSNVKRFYTKNGFKKYKDQFERSTTKVFIKENQAVAFAGRISAPILMAEKLTQNGIVYRQYETTMNQIMQGYKGKRIESYKVTVLVIRKEIKDFKDGKAIGSIITERINAKK